MENKKEGGERRRGGSTGRGKDKKEKIKKEGEKKKLTK